jgi:hypothetical protein
MTGRVALHRLPALTWTHARAFGGAVVDQFRGKAEQRRTDEVGAVSKICRCIAAVVVLPMSLMVLMNAQLRGGLFASADDRAVVAVKRQSRLLELLSIFVIVFTPTIIVVGLLFGALTTSIAQGDATLVRIALGTVGTLFWIVAGWAVLGGVLLALGSLGRSSIGEPEGLPIPPGERWTCESLAARAPGDGAAAFLLAKRTIASMPSGRVIEATARTVTLYETYLRLGFSPGKGPKVHLQT